MKEFYVIYKSVWSGVRYAKKCDSVIEMEFYYGKFKKERGFKTDIRKVVLQNE